MLLDEILHFFTHLEKGFFNTSWSFIVRPGSTSLNYLEGQRKKYQKPFSYLLIWAGLYILLHNLVINYRGFHVSDEGFALLSQVEKANVILRSHFTFFILPVLLYSAFVIYLVLGRPRYNFTEILTLSLYGGGTYFMMLFVSDIVLGLVFKVNTVSANVFLWQTILSSVYNFWFSYDIFKRVHLRFLIVRLILVAILVAVIGLLMLLYLPLAWIYLKG